MATYLWSHMTPWLKRNIHYVTHVGGHLSEVPFVGIHVRRGDKVTEGEAQRWEVDVSYVSSWKGSLNVSWTFRLPVLSARGVSGTYLTRDEKSLSI